MFAANFRTDKHTLMFLGLKRHDSPHKIGYLATQQCTLLEHVEKLKVVLLFTVIYELQVSHIGELASKAFCQAALCF